jgi:hypothetical protein
MEKVVSSRDSRAKLVAKNQMRVAKRISDSEQMVMRMCDKPSESTI